MCHLTAPDSHRLRAWTGEKDGIRFWLAMTYVDIDMYMKRNGSVGLSTEGLTAYTTGKAYSYFACDWLQEVFFHPISRQHKCCYLKTTCIPSNRVNDTHSLWLKTMKSGEIVSAYCKCMAR